MTRLSFFVSMFALGLGIFTYTTPILAGSNDADPFYSTISVDKTTLKADGIENARIIVTIKNRNLLPLENIPVSLQSSRGTQDEILAENSTTNVVGKAYFYVRSLKNGVSTFQASASGVIVNKTVNITFQNGLSLPLNPGDLIKLADDGDVKTLNDSAVYYYASNGKRYVFSNDKVYFSWYPTFDGVKIVPQDQMSLIPIGGNVTYKPGTKLVKFQTDPKTYIVTRGGVLRWAKTEDVVRGWFGAEWNKNVDDINEAFYINYKFGEPVANYLDLALDIVRTTTKSIDQDKGL